jgi:acetyl-CoA carboxylase beta subunit
MYVEKIATVSNFQELVKDWEINLRHDKGFGSPEAIYQNCREIVKIMYQEDIQKKVTVCSA